MLSGELPEELLNFAIMLPCLGRGDESSVHNLERIFVFRGMERVEVPEAKAGDIVALTGPEGVSIGDTISSIENPEALPSDRYRGADG
ncbi:MAG: hypothetical protein CM1200mP27_10950 [Chloroflexota bacterium]|nr:MAG: hypothetical protein CM1200mP27_10950 [Chloroflexota bacterium]